MLPSRKRLRVASKGAERLRRERGFMQIAPGHRHDPVLQLQKRAGFAFLVWGS
jgi:hypothetical protein